MLIQRTISKTAQPREVTGDGVWLCCSFGFVSFIRESEERAADSIKIILKRICDFFFAPWYKTCLFSYLNVTLLLKIERSYPKRLKIDIFYFLGLLQFRHLT